VKIVRNISVDAEIWAKAKQHTDSISATVNFLITRWLETEAEQYERNKIETYKSQVDELKAQLVSFQKRVEDAESERKKNTPVRVIE